MDINLNNNGFGNVGMGRATMGANAVGPGAEAKDVDAARDAKNAVTFTDARPAALAAAEPLADVPDAALSRDDALGKLVSAAFNLPPPPMPSFTE